MLASWEKANITGKILIFSSVWVMFSSKALGVDGIQCFQYIILLLRSQTIFRRVCSNNIFGKLYQNPYSLGEGVVLLMYGINIPWNSFFVFYCFVNFLLISVDFIPKFVTLSPSKLVWFFSLKIDFKN